MATIVKVTSKGREVISSRLIGGTPTQVEPLDVGWGTGGVGTGSPYTAGLSDVNMFQEASEARVGGTSSQATTASTNDTYQVIGTLTAGGAKTIAEAGLFDSTTKPFSTTVASGSTVIGSNSATGLNTAASYTPANNTFVQVDTEVLKVTAGTGTSTLTVSRAQNGSTAITTIAIGDVVTLGNAAGIATANATQFVHATFTGLALNTNDSIQFTFQVQIQST